MSEPAQNQNQTTFLPLPDGQGDVPQWIHLLPAGTFPAVGGTRLYHADNLEAIVSSSLRAGKIVLDENHATDLAAPQGGSAPAMGWISEMQVRPNGIWGRVAWTKRGREAVSDHAYRGVSPVLKTDRDTGQVLAIYRAALTNIPDLGGLQTLHHNTTAEGGSAVSYPLSKLRQRLNLPADADEAAIERALNTATQAVTLHSQVVALTGLPETATNEAVLAKLQSGQEQVTLHSQAQAKLQSRIDELENAHARLSAERFVEQAGRQKQISEQLREHLITLHAADPKTAQGIVDSLPAAPPATTTLHGAPTGTDLAAVNPGIGKLRAALGRETGTGGN